MAVIPAASLKGVNLEAIRQQSAEKAAEIERVGKLMLSGRETDDEFKALCQLLFDLGYVAKSEELLRAAAVEGDSLHRLYVTLHGEKANELFLRAIRLFADQFAVSLARLESPAYLVAIYDCRPLKVLISLPTKLSNLIAHNPDVQFTYSAEDVIVADVSEKLLRSNDSPAVISQPLIFRDQRWVISGKKRRKDGENGKRTNGIDFRRHPPAP